MILPDISVSLVINEMVWGLLGEWANQRRVPGEEDEHSEKSVYLSLLFTLDKLIIIIMIMICKGHSKLSEIYLLWLSSALEVINQCRGEGGAY